MERPYIDKYWLLRLSYFIKFNNKGNPSDGSLTE